MTSFRDNRTGATTSLAGKNSEPPANCKDLEAGFGAYIRATAGLSFEKVSFLMGIDAETLRNMCDEDDRRVLGASRIVPMMQATRTAEVVNAYLRLPGNEVAGKRLQLVPVDMTPVGTSDLLTGSVECAHESTAGLKKLVELMEGGLDPLEATILLRLYRPLAERLLGAVAQLEAIARRGAGGSS